VDDSGHRVDTSILTTSKLIYNEAIKIFYENNVIRFDSESCKAEDIVSPLATDLSLATWVAMRIGLGSEPVSMQDYLAIYSNFLGIATKSFPAIFPSLRACELYAYTDSTPCPAAILFSTANSLQSKLSNEAITFDSVGSFVVTFRKFPQMKLFVQYKAAMERWTAKNHSISDLLTVSEKDLTARIIQLVAVHHPQARTLEDMLIEQYRHVVLPATYTAIAKDSPEYWTLVDAVLCIAQKTG
jgi:hypothetical protein